jgi:hypothetical protein
MVVCSIPEHFSGQARFGLGWKNRLFRAEKILPMTVPLDVLDICFIYIYNFRLRVYRSLTCVLNSLAGKTLSARSIKLCLEPAEQLCTCVLNSLAGKTLSARSIKLCLEPVEQLCSGCRLWIVLIRSRIVNIEISVIEFTLYPSEDWACTYHRPLARVWPTSLPGAPFVPSERRRERGVEWEGPARVDGGALRFPWIQRKWEATGKWRRWSRPLLRAQ